MKKIFAIVVLIAFSGLICGCESNQTRVAEGAVVGGVVGATAGGIIGHQSGHGGEGAGIGAAAGALLGAVVGSQIQKNPQQKPSAASGQQPQGGPSPNQISLQQIVDMTKQGVHEDVIIDKIRLTNSKYTLSADDLNYLQTNGVSQKVISVMQGA
jgi:outer membrane lipoprotein SlyB